MIRKILFLTISPFNQRDFKRFGIELLEKNGFDVEVWDLTNCLFPHIAKNYKHPDPINWTAHKVFEDKNYALKNLEDSSSDTFIIPLLPYNPKFYSVFKAISDSDAKHASFCANFQPFVKTTRKGNLGKFLFYLKKLKDPVNKLKNYGFQKLPLSWLRLKPASFLLAGGEESIKHQDPVNRCTEILWIHSLDYDLYLEEKNKPFSEKPIAVFLDEYLPFHPDFFRHKITPPIEADKYYPLLNKFFTLIEKQLKLKVIVAAHPRSHYENLSYLFKGHEWIHGQTIKLIKESKLVLAHSSLALNYANLYLKPVIFLASSKLDKTYKGPHISKTAYLFGKKPIYIDRNDKIDWNFEFRVSKIHYKNYLRSYIKTDHSEELPFWQIVANKLKKGF